MFGTISFSSNDLIVFTVLALSLIVYLIVYFVISFRKKAIKREVSRTSTRIMMLNKRIEELDFAQLQSQYTFQKQFNSKAKLDKLDVDDAITGIILENNFEIIVSDGVSNSKKFGDLICLINSVHTTLDTINTTHFSSKKYYAEEDMQISSILNSVKALQPMFFFRFLYVSPKGNKTYWIDANKNCVDLEFLLNKYDEREKKRILSIEQRSLMNLKLRYAILQRDGFRCQICGRSQEDGVKLHVDHIIPVSKGGLTTPDNLRTLCDECNLGKSDSYDTYGYN